MRRVVSATEARIRVGELMRQAVENRETIIVERGGKSHIVVMSVEEYERSQKEQQWDSERRRLAAPTLLHYEVANALYRYQNLGYLSASSVQLSLRAALALPLALHGESILHWRALDLADKFSLPAAYDAHYLALAELLEGEFWRADGRLARTVQASLPWVHLAE